MACFHEMRCPAAISQGARGGPGFSTVTVVGAGGQEQSVALWSASLRRWDVTHALRVNALRDDLIALFVAVEGDLCGFRFQDPMDHEVSSLTLCEEIDSTHFQLRKAYTYGSVTKYRTLEKIAEESGGAIDNAAATQANSTVRIWNYIEVGEGSFNAVSSGWTVDLTTGIVEFASAPGYVPYATCEFDCKAKFATSQMTFLQSGATYGDWQVPVREIR